MAAVEEVGVGVLLGCQRALRTAWCLRHSLTPAADHKSWKMTMMGIRGLDRPAGHNSKAVVSSQFLDYSQLPYFVINGKRQA